MFTAALFCMKSFFGSLNPCSHLKAAGQNIDKSAASDLRNATQKNSAITSYVHCFIKSYANDIKLLQKQPNAPLYTLDWSAKTWYQTVLCQKH